MLVVQAEQLEQQAEENFQRFLEDPSVVDEGVIPLFQEALSLKRDVLGNAHPEIAESLLTLAGLEMMQGRPLQAEGLLKEALTINQKAFGEEHPATLDSLKLLAAAYLQLGRYAEAEELAQIALTGLENLYGPEDQEVVNTREFLDEIQQLQETNEFFQLKQLKKKTLQ